MARMTSREFNQDTGRAKKAAEHGPVFVTDRRGARRKPRTAQVQMPKRCCM